MGLENLKSLGWRVQAHPWDYFLSMWKYKKGNYVRVKDSLRWGEVIDSQGDSFHGYMMYEILGSPTNVFWELEENLEPFDIKTPSRHKFLSHLKKLLDVYGASIYFSFKYGEEIGTTTIAIGEDSVKYSNTDGIDVDNVFEYD